MGGFPLSVFLWELWWKLYITGNLGLYTNIHTPFSSHSSTQHPTWNQGKGFSPILSSKNGKNDMMKTSSQRSRRKNPLDSILFWSAVFCGSSNPPFKGKTETTATTRYSMILFTSASRIYVLWWKSRIIWTTFSLFLQRRDQGEQRLPLLTPVSSCNSSLNLEDDYLRFWQSLAWKSYVLVHTSFWLQLGKEWTNNCWRLSLTC